MGKKKILELANSRRENIKEVETYSMPTSYEKSDGKLDIDKKMSLLTKRYNNNNNENEKGKSNKSDSIDVISFEKVKLSSTFICRCRHWSSGLFPCQGRCRQAAV